MYLSFYFCGSQDFPMLQALNMSEDKNLGITLSLIKERKIKDKGLNWAPWMESHWKGPVIH